MTRSLRLRRRWFLPVLVLLMMSLAGCTGGDRGASPEPVDDPDERPDDEDESDAPSPPLPTEPVTHFPLLIDFDFTGCSGLAFSQPTPIDRVQAMLPDGFVAAEYTPNGVPTGQALLQWDLYLCTNLTTASATVDSPWFGHVYTFVEPPEDVNGQPTPEADIHEFTFQMLATPGIMTSLWMAAGYDTYSANGTITPPTGAPAWTAELGDFRLNANVPAVPGQDQGSFTFARYTPVGGEGDPIANVPGILQWTGTQSFPEGTAGIGRLQVPAGSHFDGQGNLPAGGLDGTAIVFTGNTYADQDLYLVVEPA